MEEKNKITTQEQKILNNLYTVLTNHNIPNETYSISENYPKSDKVKVCLVKTQLGAWNTCLKLHEGVHDSIYHPSLSTAIIKFIQYVAPDDNQYLLMLQEFLNLNTEPLLTNKKIKSRRKKR